ncbi:hypothetical protein LYNGBM3L_58460 [Moorena producens 3L]|uniref:Uncharacterized protein n=1 Tax=Moorena producens 3L TaxID=489825 RepID=F4XZY0_9CYAN|nr:hypothetical protein LYNGBM3L_58460 [Moorena producens 3L]
MILFKQTGTFDWGENPPEIQGVMATTNTCLV